MPETQIDVIKAVSEAKCPNRKDVPVGWVCKWAASHELEYDCPVCQGSGLRWPSLSRECLCDWQLLCCHGSSRVPDVSLEKVLDAAWAEGPKKLVHAIVAVNAQYQGYNPHNNPLEAACAALLATCASA